MHFVETSLFYLVVGVGVGIAVATASHNVSKPDRLFRTIVAVLFWPLYLPFLFEGQGTPTAADAAAVTVRPLDALDSAIQQTERELDAALGSLDGWADDVLGSDRIQIQELKAGWQAQAARLREMDRLLLLQSDTATEDHWPQDTPGRNPISVIDPALVQGSAVAECVRQSERGRRQNIERLREIRDQAQHELLATLTKVRELVTMLHLARFTGALPSRTQELVAQIAAAIEGLSEVSRWQGTGAEPVEDRLGIRGLSTDR